MNKFASLLLILFIASCQASLALDEDAMRVREFKKLAASGPVKGAEFSLAATINNEHNVGPLETQYFGFQASDERICDRTSVISGRYGADVKLTRRREFDLRGLACFDTLSSSGAVGRIWIDTSSEQKNQFPQCYKYKTWGMLALLPHQEP